MMTLRRENTWYISENTEIDPLHVGGISVCLQQSLESGVGKTGPTALDLVYFV